MKLSHRKQRATLMIVGAIVCLGTTFGVSSSANAAQAFRAVVPLNAGSELLLPHNHDCTVGAVLKSRGAFANLTSFTRANRFVVIAAHCGNVGDTVSTARSGQVGVIVWKSSDRDIALAQIPPRSQGGLVCDPRSAVVHCQIVRTYVPQAVGRIFLDNSYGAPQSYPVPRIGTPGHDERFCTSGAQSGVMCAWHPNPWIEGYGRGLTIMRNASEGNVIPGDSGGPVAGLDGTLYGIIAESGNLGGPAQGTAGYTPISDVFREQPNFELAPS
ncbi:MULTISPECIES: hypothetical protein [unclassified Rathayibacter]|uniref:hypothetical protein n=1 Tax=unclassified Rathayibacter TaxID=2609250 RepID=UPI00188CBE60|nr:MULTISPECIES: hypothetical protein [unclassified Rathayibacter]MBF4461143.1 hypothetical protein [Rathayibacter sp. VKM Ac-2879]MBF4502555.1 hypothetical protein [Rathayibacter sp. VKM Ac-2878]